MLGPLVAAATMTTTKHTAPHGILTHAATVPMDNVGGARFLTHSTCHTLSILRLRNTQARKMKSEKMAEQTGKLDVA